MVIKSLSAWLGAVVIILAGTANGAEPKAVADADGTPFVVYCYDSGRDVVTRALSSECTGTVISEDEARKVQERYANRVAARVHAPSPTVRGGAKLVSMGTAFYVDERGKLVTNNHVIARCDAVSIMSGDHRDVDVTVTAVDAASDLALLESALPAPAIAVFEGSPIVESPVETVGFPNQGLAPIDPLLTTGTVLKVDPTAAPVAHVVLKADIRHGNSGGPIFDRYGRVVGVIAAKLDSPRVYRETHREVTDVGVGIGLPSLLGFLAAHNVDVHVEKDGPVVTPEQMLARARAFVVRADCWKK